MGIKRIVSNTGPLITLEKMKNGYRFIRKLYDQIIIPPAVLSELSSLHSSDTAYLTKYGIEDLIRIQADFPMIALEGIERLDTGETQAISLAAHLGLNLLIEEKDGRKIAKMAELEISGIGGQILRAHKKNIITVQEALRKIKELYDHHRINLKTYKELSEAVSDFN